MEENTNELRMEFRGDVADRKIFIKTVRFAVINFTGKRMQLDALITEIAKNIFDHAEGKGLLAITRRDDVFEFIIKDEGQEPFDFDLCKAHSRLAGNGTNFGIGLGMIQDLAGALGINLRIDTSRGFSYSGVYRPNREDA